MADGGGVTEKGFKAEWMTVKGRQSHINYSIFIIQKTIFKIVIKDGTLFVGGMGKEYVLPDGSIPHHNPEYVKQISILGNFILLKWVSEYLKVRSIFSDAHFFRLEYYLCVI